MPVISKLASTMLCPSCHQRLNSVSHVNTAEGPSDGDYTVCLYCFSVLRFADKVSRVIVVPPAEWLWFPVADRNALKLAIAQAKDHHARMAARDAAAVRH